MKKTLLFILLSLVCVNYSYSANRFWVAGTGNWSDINHWSLTSGGVPGASVPLTADDAIFDALSGLTAPSVVTLDVAVLINTLDYSAVTTSFVFDSPIALNFELRGSIIGNPSGVLFTGVWPVIDMNTTLTGEDITSGGTIWIQDFDFTGEMLSLIDDFKISEDIPIIFLK